jgi:hypothetical protein
MLLGVNSGEAATRGSAYNLADLTVLAQEGPYQEFLDHAHDIRPSERGEKWKSMVIEMALKHANHTLSQSPVPKHAFKRTEQLYRWPVLRQDDVYRARRTEIGVRYLKTCLAAQTPCWEDLKNFWKEDSSDPDMAVSLAEMIKEKKDAPYTLWTLLERPLKTPFSEFYCKKDFVMKALWEKLSLDFLKLGVEGNFLTKIEETIHVDCLPTLVSESKKRVVSPDNEGDRELGFEILKSTGKADQKLKDFFYTLYLLEHPSRGELMNLAWNNLNQLGKSADRRERVMEQIKKLDPLPDNIMGSMDETKRRVVLRHMKANFPEYFDYYSEQCVSYYGGTKKFSRGNPTMKCDELMNSDLASELLPNSKIQLFQTVKKI